MYTPVTLVWGILYFVTPAILEFGRCADNMIVLSYIVVGVGAQKAGLSSKARIGKSGIHRV